LANKKIKFTSPFGAAKYPHISKPDTVGKYADNKYKTKIVFQLGDAGVSDFIKACDDAAKEMHGSAGASLYKPYVLNENEGTVEFVFKTQYAPAIFDARNQQAQGVQIGGGSIIRILGSFVEYDKGLTAAMNQVQVKQLNSFGASGFGAVEGGFEYDGSEFEPAAETPDSEVAAGGTKSLDI
jgi:hypothetical protein